MIEKTAGRKVCDICHIPSAPAPYILSLLKFL